MARVSLELRRGSKLLTLLNGDALTQGVRYRIRGKFKSRLNTLGIADWSVFQVR